ncbi:MULTISPECIES: hypothetical protein [unclassified Stenotrophomonas]|uniref:AbiU2 domain-containing protein n=1 Tax=unclassified Stenotrophomonas TaxID=196198 RepID=UPI00259B46C1|nr:MULTISPECIES: hypothetical protein [unclassified Stenotrophomonas]WNB79619.1 hypothetical protein Q9R16_17705 [Stenotrophomonas sp. 9]
MRRKFEHQKVLPLQQFAQILNRELRQMSEHWWFFTELDGVGLPFPHDRHVVRFFYSTKSAHFRSAILGLHNSVTDKYVSIPTLVKRTNGRADLQTLNGAAKALFDGHVAGLAGIKDIRDKMVAHWDDKNLAEDVMELSKVELKLIDGFVEAVESFRPLLTQISGIEVLPVSRDEIGEFSFNLMAGIDRLHRQMP